MKSDRLLEYKRECINCDHTDTGPASSTAECPECGGKLYITEWTGNYL